jgi:anti-sigma regulatory factor (Ser/Thr protein kinase)
LDESEAIRLSLEAEPASVGIARRAVAELAARSGAGEPALGDVKTVVSEACANVVRHAYGPGGGSFELEATREDAELEIVVRDIGRGLQPQLASGPSLRLGLGLISALSRGYEISRHGERGTEVRIRMALG